MRYFYICIRPMISWTTTAVLAYLQHMEWDRGPSASSGGTGTNLRWSPGPGDTTEHLSRAFVG